MCEAAAAGRTALFVNAEWFFVDVRDTYKPGSTSTEKDVLKKYTNIDVLCLDDLGANQESSDAISRNALRLLYLLLDTRYSQAKKTYISSNHKLDDFMGMYGPYIERRIRETCQEIPLTEVKK